MIEPSSWQELSDWLEAHSPLFSLLQAMSEDERRHIKSVAQCLSILEFIDVEEQAPVAKAAKDFADLREDTLKGLTLRQKALLYWRLEAAGHFVRQFTLPLACPIEYPTATFREFMSWLLVDWWGAHGRRFIASYYFDSWRIDPEDS